MIEVERAIRHALALVAAAAPRDRARAQRARPSASSTSAVLPTPDGPVTSTSRRARPRLGDRARRACASSASRPTNRARAARPGAAATASPVSRVRDLAARVGRAQRIGGEHRVDQLVEIGGHVGVDRARARQRPAAACGRASTCSVPPNGGAPVTSSNASTPSA